MENGNVSRKKSKKKKIRSNSPQTSNGSEKYFCGFNNINIRNICEQMDSTEIQPEVYTRLAEDATYKIMEVVNVSNQIIKCLKNPASSIFFAEH
jgi:hypothetical protein